MHLIPAVNPLGVIRYPKLWDQPELLPDFNQGIGENHRSLPSILPVGSGDDRSPTCDTQFPVDRKAASGVGIWPAAGTAETAIPQIQCSTEYGDLSQL